MPAEFHARSISKPNEPTRGAPDAGVATVWLALYLLILVATLARPAVSGVLQLATLF